MSPPSSLRSAAIASSFLLPAASALTFEATHRNVWRSPRDVGVLGHQLRKRDVGQFGEVQLLDMANAQYVTNVTVNGEDLFVTIDTGSSDLNIEGQVTGAQDTNIEIDVTFAVGAEVGVMSFATVEFAGHTVQDQVFNHVQQIQSPPIQGLVGLGPSIGSELWFKAQSFIASGTLAHNAADSLLDRIFQANTSTPNFISFTLGREDDPNSNDNPKSTFTVGDYIQGFENISSMPQLDVLNAPTALQSSQHFTILVDGVSVNGTSVSLPSSAVQGTASGKLVAVLDSGFTLPQVVPAIANAFYQPIPGAKFTNISTQGTSQQFWVLPCGAEIQASFNFQGHDVPIHPLDLNFDASFIGLADRAGQLCVGAFQPIQDDATAALAGLADMILGMGFLRNTYSLYNYGDFVDSNADVRKPPFVQLLPITDRNQASIEFHNIRGGQPQTYSNSGQSTGTSSSGGSSDNQSFAQKNLPLIIGISAAVVLVIIGGIVTACIIGRRNKARKYQNLGAPAPMAYQPGGAGGAGPYQPYQPYQSQRSFGAAGAGQAGYDDPFRDTSGPGGEVYAMNERNPDGRFSPQPPPNRGYTPSPQPGQRAYAHSPQPSFSAPAYDPPRGTLGGPGGPGQYGNSAPYDPPMGPPPPAAQDPFRG